MRFFKFILLFCVSFLFLTGCKKESKYEIVAGHVVGTVYVLDKEEGKIWWGIGDKWKYTDLEGVAKFQKIEAQKDLILKSKEDDNIKKEIKSVIKQLKKLKADGKNGDFVSSMKIEENKRKAIEQMFFVNRNFNGVDISTNPKSK